MEGRKYRVVVIGTGTVCSIACRGLIGRDNMELVGCWGHKETAAADIGQDAGLLDGHVPAGVLVTDNAEDIWALKPDCAIIAINITNPVAAEKIVGKWFIDCLGGSMWYQLRCHSSYSLRHMEIRSSSRA